MKTKHNKMVLEFQKLFKNNSKRTYTRKFSLNISQARSGIKSCPLHPFRVLVTKKDSRYGAKRTEKERTFTANWTVIAFSQNRFIIPRSIGVTFSREAQKAFVSFCSRSSLHLISQHPSQKSESARPAARNNINPGSRGPFSK